MVVDTDHKDGKAVFFPPSRESQREKERKSILLIFLFGGGKGCNQVGSIRDTPASSLSSCPLLYESLWEHNFSSLLNTEWSDFPLLERCWSLTLKLIWGIWTVFTCAVFTWESDLSVWFSWELTLLRSYLLTYLGQLLEDTSSPLLRVWGRPQVYYTWCVSGQNKTTELLSGEESLIKDSNNLKNKQNPKNHSLVGRSEGTWDHYEKYK